MRTAVHGQEISEKPTRQVQAQFSRPSSRWGSSCTIHTGVGSPCSVLQWATRAQHCENEQHRQKDVISIPSAVISARLSGAIFTNKAGLSVDAPGDDLTNYTCMRKD